MRTELLLAGLGTIVYLAFVAIGIVAARKVQNDLQPPRVPIITYAVFLEYSTLAVSSYLAATGVFMLLDSEKTVVDWQLPVLFLVLATMQGFPRGILLRPGLTNSGLVLLGTLYRWEYFASYERVSTGRIRFLYRKAWLGIRSLTVRVRESNIDSFVALLEANGVNREETET